MTLLKVVAWVLGIGLLLQIYGYVNLKVSYKYEVDLMITNINTDENLSDSQKSERLKKVGERKEEIFKQQKIVSTMFFVFLTGFIITVFLNTNKTVIKKFKPSN